MYFIEIPDDEGVDDGAGLLPGVPGDLFVEVVFVTLLDLFEECVVLLVVLFLAS